MELMNKLEKPTSSHRNIIFALHNRLIGTKQSNSMYDNLHVYGESLAATLATNNKKVDLPPRTRSTFIVTFSPDNELVASCHGDHNIHVSEVNSGCLVQSLSGHQRSPWCVQFHPNNSDILASGCLNGEVRVWDLRGGGSESWTAGEEETMTISSLSFHPSDHVVMVAAGNEIYFWDWSLPKPFASVKTNSSERVRLARFSPLGDFILTGVANLTDDNSGSEEGNPPQQEEPTADWGPPTLLTPGPAERGSLRAWLNSGRNRTSPVLGTSRTTGSWSRTSTNVRPRNRAEYTPRSNSIRNRIRCMRNRRLGGDAQTSDNNFNPYSTNLSQDNVTESVQPQNSDTNQYSIALRANRSDGLPQPTRQTEENLVRTSQPVSQTSNEQQFTPLVRLSPSLPMFDSSTLPRQQDSMLPRQQDPMLPRQQDPTLLRQQDLMLTRQQDPTLLRQQDLMLTRQQDPMLPRQQDPMLPRQQDPVLPRQQDPMLPRQLEVQQQDLPSLPQQESSVTSQEPEVTHQRSRLQRLNEFRSRMAELSQAHTYSRDHERILHASVSVNAEIQHQYNRLQLLRQERRRLELRLQQLQHNQQNTETPALPDPAELFPELDESGSSMEGDLTSILTSRIQDRILNSLRNPGVEVSVTMGNSNVTPPPEPPLEVSVNPTFHEQNLDPARLNPPTPGLPDFDSFAQRVIRFRRLRRPTTRARASHLRSNINHILSLYPDPHRVLLDRTGYRLQWWDFTKLKLPEISRPDLNILVPSCKIYNDSSLDISKDGTRLATFVPSEQGFNNNMMQVSVFSLEPCSLGNLLYRRTIGSSAVCLSLSPLGNYLAVGLKHRDYIRETRDNSRSLMAQIVKLNKTGDSPTSVVHHVTHPIQADTPQRYVNINTISWLPGIGEGLVYGTNNGELRICHT